MSFSGLMICMSLDQIEEDVDANVVNVTGRCSIYVQIYISTRSELISKQQSHHPAIPPRAGIARTRLAMYWCRA
jgi:hypothetical protein